MFAVQGRSLARLLPPVAGLALGLGAAWLCLTGLTPPLAAAAPAGRTFTVNSAADVTDFDPGDGACETALGNHICTLRAAVQEVDAGLGGDTIRLQPNTLYQLTQSDGNNLLNSGNLDISHTVILLGAGPDSTIIDGNGSITGERVFDIVAGTVVISGVTIENGQAQDFGGGLLNTGRLTIVNSHVLSNTVDGGANDLGGGIANIGVLTVTGSLVRGNRTGYNNSAGGGIANDVSGPISVIDSTISDNQTDSSTGAGRGGGIFGRVRLVNSTISGNTGGRGGGLYVDHSVLINSTIVGNNATGVGGGLYASGGAVSLYNITVSDNLANSDGVGSGLGGGVAVLSGTTFNFINTLIAGNSQIVVPGPVLYADNCSGTVNALGFDVLDDNEHDPASCTVNGLPSHADPLLGSLQDNGGPTLTEAPLPGSSAIDAGNPGGCDDELGAPLRTDQRGAPRPANATGVTRCDIGAVEIQRLVDLPFVRR